MPEIFALGSRMENLSFDDFLRNPTRITNALRQIRGTLKVDGLMCYCDPFLEAEALGVRVEWSGRDSRTLTSPPALGDVERRLDPVGRIQQMGRIPIAREVLQRLKTMLRDEPALMMRVTGPYTLARQLDGETSGDLTLSAEIVAAVVKSYLEAGADVILLEESASPIDPTGLAAWKDSLDPIINVIRFFEALPVLRVPGDGGEKDDGFVATQNWDCGLCISARLAGVRDWSGTTPWLGVDLPLDDLVVGADCESTVGALFTRPVAFLSSRDLPRETELKNLTRVLTSVRSQVEAIR